MKRAVLQEKTKQNYIQQIEDLFFVARNQVGKYRIPRRGKKMSPFYAKTNNLHNDILAHLQGRYQIGSYTGDSRNECVYACLDYDLPKRVKEAYLRDSKSSLFAKEKEKLRRRVLADHIRFIAQNIPCVLEDSVGGFHIWFFFGKAEKLSDAHDFVSSLESCAGEAFPKQSQLKKGQTGNFVRLPGHYHSMCSNGVRGTGSFFDADTEEWVTLQGPSSWGKFLSLARQSRFSLCDLQFERSKPDPEPKKLEEPKPVLFSNDKGVLVLRAAIETLKQTPFVYNSFDDYKRLLFAMKHACETYSDFDYNDFDQIASKSSGYNEKNNRKHWNRAKAKGAGASVTFKSLIYKAEQENSYLFEQKKIEFGVKRDPLLWQNKRSALVEDISVDDGFGGVGAIKPVAFAPSDYKEMSDLEQPLRELGAKNILMFSAPTGIGKSFFYAKKAVEAFVETGRGVTILTNSIESVDTILSYVKHEIQSHSLKIDLTRNISGDDGGSDKQNKDGSSAQKVGQIAVSTYSYLGRDGDTERVYKMAKKLVKDRFVMCDEIQKLFDVCRVNIQMANRVKANKNTYNSVSKCPKSCATCIKSYLRKAPDSYNKQHFYRSFTRKSEEQHTEKPVIADLPATMWDIQHYDDDDGLFNMMLDENIDYEINEVVPTEQEDERPDDIIFSEYISNLMTKLKFPQLSMVSPTKDESFVRPSEIVENDEGVQYPVNPCQIPHLKGFDILPILQLLEAEKIVMCSATIPDDAEKILADIAPRKEWSYKVLHIDNVPVTYDATFLTTRKKLSVDCQAKILERITHPTIFVADKKSEAKSLYTKTKKVRKDDVERFDSGDYIEQESERFRPIAESKYMQILTTYLRAAMLTGTNRPDKNVMAIDCSGFHPNIICTVRDKEERKKEIIQKVRSLIIQAIGRLLRSEVERIRGQTVKDNRKIVFLLHGLTFDLEVEQKLFHNMEICEEIFLTDKKPYLSVVAAIDQAANGEKISDYRKEEETKLIEKAAKNGKRSLSKSQAKNMNAEEYEKFKKKQKSEKTLNRLLSEAEKFDGSWRDFYDKKNIDRYTKKGILTTNQVLEIRYKFRE